MKNEGLRCPEHGIECEHASPGSGGGFRCRWCKRVRCGANEGGVDAADPVGNGLCDSCWAGREKRLKRGGK